MATLQMKIAAIYEQYPGTWIYSYFHPPPSLIYKSFQNWKIYKNKNKFMYYSSKKCSTKRKLCKIDANIFVSDKLFNKKSVKWKRKQLSANKSVVLDISFFYFLPYRYQYFEWNFTSERIERELPFSALCNK